MRSLFIIATCIATALILFLSLTPPPVFVAFIGYCIAGAVILALLGYAGLEAWPYLHRYLQKRRIME